MGLGLKDLRGCVYRLGLEIFLLVRGLYEGQVQQCMRDCMRDKCSSVASSNQGLGLGFGCKDLVFKVAGGGSLVDLVEGAWLVLRVEGAWC